MRMITKAALVLLVAIAVTVPSASATDRTTIHVTDVWQNPSNGTTYFSIAPGAFQESFDNREVLCDGSVTFNDNGVTDSFEF